MNANSLKILAAVVMFLDHFASVFIAHNEPLSLILRLLGRAAAPVFCFFIAQGFHYTSNVKKYIIRLLILAAVSHLPYNLAFGLTSIESLDSFVRTFFRATSVVLPLAMGLVALAAIKSEAAIFKANRVAGILLKLVILAACCAVSYRANWNYIAVLWIVGFGLFRKNFTHQLAAFSLVGIFYLLVQPFRQFGIFHEQFPQWHQLGIFLAIPLFVLYNGEAGKKSPVMAWFFYVFYPAHLILLFLLNRLTPLASMFEKILS